MSWALFIDESGQDRRDSPYEVLAGIAVEDRKIWQLIRNLSDAQAHIFGKRLFEEHRLEAKATKLLKRKVFKHAAQMPPLDPTDRARLALEIIEHGEAPTMERLTALAQSKIAYCHMALKLCQTHQAIAFASIVPREAIRPSSDFLRKDYAFFFERFFKFLNAKTDDPMGYLVFDELDRSACHILLGQVSNYFVRTRNGRTRSRLIIPEPFFVHSDMTSLVQMADLIAYIISWGLRLNGMTEPARDELSTLADQVHRLKFRHESPGGDLTYGLTFNRDVRPRGAVTSDR